MVLLYILLAIVLLVVILIFTVASKIIAHFDTAAADISITMLWLYPVLKSVVTKENNGFTLNIYLFNKKILHRKLAGKSTNQQNSSFITKFKLSKVHVNGQYGFVDPFFTGIAYGAVNMLVQLVKPESVIIKPDFLALKDYVYFDATARLNIGRSLLKMV